MFDFKNESNFIQLESDPDCFLLFLSYFSGQLVSVANVRHERGMQVGEAIQ